MSRISPLEAALRHTGPLRVSRPDAGDYAKKNGRGTRGACEK
jgi:hypothetical protein